MKPKWLLETDVFDENLERLVAEIKKQDMEVKVHRFMPFDSDTASLKLYEPDDCVIFYGSLNVAKHLKRIAPWVPGVYCTLDNYKCSHYYHLLGDLLLNQRYVMLPFGELNRCKFFLFNHLGENNAVFVRPDRGDKIFTGQVCTLETWDKDFDLMSFYHTAPHEICVVAQPKNIIAEWRLVIADNKVIAGSEYKPKEINNVPESVLSFANHILLNVTISPDPVWVLDIAETDEHVLEVLEINSFSCSGLYGCNLRSIVSKVSEIALQEWSDCHMEQTVINLPYGVSSIAYQLSCDNNDCVEWKYYDCEIWSESSGEKAIQDLIANGREIGWLITEDKCLCPACKELKKES